MGCAYRSSAANNREQPSEISDGVPDQYELQLYYKSS
jgi:hypothetical protein